MINPEQRSAIFQAALAARTKAYAPYSNYAVELLCLPAAVKSSAAST
jgi:cytidine deaminase